MRRRELMLLAAGAAWPALAGAAGPPADPLAALTTEQRRAVTAFLRKKGRPGEGSAEANNVIAADLDADGKADLALLWTFLGPTFWYSGLAVLPGRGQWRSAIETQLVGMVERMSLQGSVIRIDAKTPGPNDPRCCPSRPTVTRYRVAGGKLAKA